MPLRRQTVRFALFSKGFDIDAAYQIIKEKLAFPSGTATAQLIGVLYREPTRIDYEEVDTGYVRRRRAVPATETTGVNEQTPLIGEDLNGVQADQERTMIEHKGWRYLLYSFIASSGITVGLSHVLAFNYSRYLASCIFLPLRLCFARVWILPREPMALVVHAQSLVYWTRHVQFRILVKSSEFVYRYHYGLSDDVIDESRTSFPRYRGLAKQKPRGCLWDGRFSLLCQSTVAGPQETLAIWRLEHEDGSYGLLSPLCLPIRSLPCCQS